VAGPGFVRPRRVLTNSGAKPGDVLLLTKPLGVGVLTTAAKAGLAEPAVMDRIYRQMAALNRTARDIMVKYRVHSCTDVTGFALLGHSFEMAQGSGCTVHIQSGNVPFHPEAWDLAAMGLIPAGAYRNRDYAEKGVTVRGNVSRTMQDLLYDPQTSGGLLMAAFFMATDPVSCPSTRDGQLVFGIFAGILIGLFRVKGASPDSTTYAILIADLVGPVIDDLIIPEPFGYRIPKDRKKAIPKPVFILLAITVIAGLALSAVYGMTKDTIATNQASANKAALMEVLPEASDFTVDDDLQTKIAAQGDTYGPDFGGAKIESAAVGMDGSGNAVGYAVTVFNSDSYDGGLTLVVGVKADGTVTGISFTELHDTAGMGMRCGDPEFKDQFNNVKVSKFTLNKSGGSTADDQIDSVSGASVTSGAVVNAVNAALDLVSGKIG